LKQEEVGANTVRCLVELGPVALRGMMNTRPHLLQTQTTAPRRDDDLRARLHHDADQWWTKLGREHPELADTIAFGRGLVTRYIDDLPAPGMVSLTQEQATEKLSSGLPLLEDEDLDLDLRGIRHFFFRLCSWAGTQPELAAGADRLQRGMVSGNLSVDDLIAAALAGDGELLDGVAAQYDVPIELVQTLTGFSVSAALMETARSLQPLIEGAGVAWQEAVCPVCGGPPLLAELQDGTRMLRCAVCGDGWPFPQDQCAHCGADQRVLHVLESVGDSHKVKPAKGTPEAKYQVELCDRCHGFLKMVRVTTPTPAELLTIEDAALLHLDAEAREQGYFPTPTFPDAATSLG
jgi:FdhE protein